MADAVATEGTVAQEVLLAPEPPPALVVEVAIKAVEQAAPAPAKVDAPPVAVVTLSAGSAVMTATPATPQPLPLIVNLPVYVCKKHKDGTAYLVLEGTAFCGVCLLDFLKWKVKPMTLKKAP